MFLREKVLRVERLKEFRSIDIDVENLTGVAWEKVNQILRVRPRMMFMPVKMATLSDNHIEGNLIRYAIYTRDLVLFKMLKHFADKHSFLWEFNYVATRCQLRFDYEPYFRTALKRIQISQQKLGIGIIESAFELSPYNNHKAYQLVEEALDKELDKMQRKMPAHVLWRLCSLINEWSIKAGFQQPITYLQAGRHYKNTIPSPLTDNKDGKPWIRGNKDEYSRAFNLENDVAVMLHLNDILDQQMKQAIGNIYQPRMRSKL